MVWCEFLQQAPGKYRPQVSVPFGKTGQAAPEPSYLKSCRAMNHSCSLWFAIFVRTPILVTHLRSPKMKTEFRAGWAIARWRPFSLSLPCC